MQGLGNDFIIIDNIHQTFAPDAGQIRHLSDRHFGIGFDQLLLVEKARGDADFRYRIFNANGEEVEQCGNGARCFVRFVHEQGLTDKKTIRVETLQGIITPTLGTDGDISVNMGTPCFEPADIPFQASHRAPTYPLIFNGKQIEICAVSMGNPHAVQIVPDIEQAPVTREGPLIATHPCFPKGVNAGFMQIIDRSHIKLRVFERGAGETLACGTGACAATVCGILLGKLNHDVLVRTSGGNLRIRWQEGDQPVWMTGPAETVFTGEIEL
ncbi:MAG: hypothetical protein RI993_320 [Pseudomonadota bacterium]|jgi:diaminopimelate epimerase